jgi:hypothetical protein
MAALSNLEPCGICYITTQKSTPVDANRSLLHALKHWNSNSSFLPNGLPTCQDVPDNSATRASSKRFRQYRDLVSTEQI